MISFCRPTFRTWGWIGNAVLQTEARVTLIDALLAAAILIGIALNASLGWWSADPVSALVIVYYGAADENDRRAEVQNRGISDFVHVRITSEPATL